MTPAAFKASLAHDPPGGMTPALAALWQAGKGDWDKAHAHAQAEESADAAWVHAYLHRVEGDVWNARYWYAKAGRAPATVPLEQEWEEMVAALLLHADRPDR